MSEIRWTVSGARDYRNIIERLEDQNPAAARRIGDAISRRVERLASLPRIGRPGRVEGTRELVIVRTPYMVIYHIENDAAVVIDRVLHSA